MIRRLLGRLTLVGLAWTAAAGAQATGGDDGIFAAPDGSGADGADEEAPPLQRAREAFLEGRRLMDEGLWAEAATAFQEALSAMPTPGLHFYLGVCLEEQGDPFAARGAFLDAEALLLEQPAADVAALVPDAIQRVESKLSRLEVYLYPNDATLRLDGTTWTPARTPWLEPGPHVFSAEAPGFSPRRVEVEAVAGVLTRVEVVLEPMAPPPPAPSATAVAQEEKPPAPADAVAPPSSLPKVAFWGSVAFGTLGAAVGFAGVAWHVDASARVVAAQAELDQAGQDDPSACVGPIEDVGTDCRNLRAAVSAEESATILIASGFAVAGVGALGALTSWAVFPNERFAVRGRVGLGRVELALLGRF